MITLYELKQNSCFRCCYKSPLIRNVFLMMVLFVVTMFIYMIYFWQSGSSYTTMMKVLNGLNSHTFNYLEEHADLIKANNTVPVKMDEDGIEPRTREFFSDCVRLNRPC